MLVIPDARFFARDPESRGNIEGYTNWPWLPGSRASLAPRNDSGLVTRPKRQAGFTRLGPVKTVGRDALTISARRAWGLPHLRKLKRAGISFSSGAQEVIGFKEENQGEWEVRIPAKGSIAATAGR